MRFLALETDVNKVKKRFISDNEEEILMTYYHGASFLFASLREIVITLIIFAIGITAWMMGAPMLMTVGILFVLWFFFVFFAVLKAYIDWSFDFILVTTDKVILVDQTSIIKQSVKPIHIENIGSVTAVTQFWDIFHFGIVQMDLKEGEGGEKITLKYVPHSVEVASRISDAVTNYQRHPLRLRPVQPPAQEQQAPPVQQTQ